MNENRRGRNTAGGLFVTGGILTLFILKAVQGFGHSQAGMSAGSKPGAPSRDAAVIPLLCSYFTCQGGKYYGKMWLEIDTDKVRDGAALLTLKGYLHPASSRTLEVDPALVTVAHP